MPQLKPLFEQVRTVEMSTKTSCLTLSFVRRVGAAEEGGLGSRTLSVKHWYLGLSLLHPSSNPGTQVCTRAAVGLLECTRDVAWVSVATCAFELHSGHRRKVPDAPRVGG